MARKIRVEYAGAAYHVMARGNQGRDIYGYVRGGEARPRWFVTECVLGNLGLPPEGRKGYEACIEGQVLELELKRGRKELAEEWKAVRRGWYVGGAEFKERMLALVEQPLRQGRSGSYSGEAKRAHGEAEAERLLARGLAALGLAEGQLAETRKGAWEKEVLTWWLCQHTTARRRWVSERLGMGDESKKGSVQ